jgi:hypothetical protein
MAVSIEHSCSQQLNCRGIRLLRRVLVPCAWPSVRSTECLRVSNAGYKIMDCISTFRAKIDEVSWRCQRTVREWKEPNVTSHRGAVLPKSATR